MGEGQVMLSNKEAIKRFRGVSGAGEVILVICDQDDTHFFLMLDGPVFSPMDKKAHYIAKAIHEIFNGTNSSGT